MERLESAERRLMKAVTAVELQLASAEATREKAQKGLQLVETIEQQADQAIRQLKDLIRSGEAGGHG